MSLNEADFRKLFWMQGNFCVHYQWEIILASIVSCILLIRYADPSSSAAAGSSDVFPSSHHQAVNIRFSHDNIAIYYIFTGYQYDHHIRGELFGSGANKLVAFSIMEHEEIHCSFLDYSCIYCNGAGLLQCYHTILY